MTPNYEALRAEAERLADEVADLQKQEAKHVQALLALADQNPDLPVAPIVLHRLSRRHDPKLPAIPGWARIIPPDVADREVLRLMEAPRAQGMPVAEQVELVLASGDRSVAVHEQQRREAPWREALAENNRREEERRQELQRAQKWELEMQLRRGHAIRAAEDAAQEKAIPAAHRERYLAQLAEEDALIVRYREAQQSQLVGSAGGAQ